LEPERDPGVDIADCRRQRPYSRREYIGRVLWALARPAFRFSPRPMFGWRRWMLRAFGATVGRDAHVYPSTRIYIPWNLVLGREASIGEDALVYNLGPVTIGERATVSHRAHLCAGTHDHTDPGMPLVRPPIAIGDEAWICADAFIGPGVHVGEGAVCAAGSVVVRDVPGWQIVGGNPARPIGERKLAK